MLENMEYKSPAPLLEDTYSSLQKAIQEDARMKSIHSDQGTSLWPSAASIEYTELDPATGEIKTKVDGACLRQSFYRMTRVEPTESDSVRSLRVTTLGQLAEDIYRKWFHAVPGYRVVFPDINGKKLRFHNKTTGISGEVDLVLQLIETGMFFGVDMKTYDGPDAAIDLVGYNAAKKAYRSNMRYVRKGDPKKVQEPFPKVPNLLQVMLYLEEFWEYPIHLWKLIYGARDKGPDAEFDISLGTHNGERVPIVNGKMYTQFTLKGIYDRYAKLTESIQSNTLPPRDYVPEYSSYEITNGNYPKWMKDKVAGKLKDDDDPVVRDWRCQYCSYLGQCLGEPSNHAKF
jgi:hypothetical protein